MACLNTATRGRKEKVTNPARRRLAVEVLEDRRLLDATGLAFGNAPYLTLSFAPDGTAAAGHSSQLFSKLNSIATQEQWQQTILSAFQEWVIHTNADIGLVEDQGQPFGTLGDTTRDDRFGDVRIGAIPLDTSLVAISVPHDQPISGTWVADVLLNSEADIRSLSDLHSIILHEAGHVFGLDHSDDDLSVMFQHGGGNISKLASSDIDELQRLYGVRGDDAFEFLEDEEGNGTRENATEIEFEHPSDSETKGLTPAIIYGDISRRNDQDVFRFEKQEGYAGAVTFSLRVDGISQLRSNAAIQAEDGEVLATGQPGVDGKLSLTVPSTTDDLYFQVASDATADEIHQIGGYSLVVTMDDRLETDPDTIERMSDGRLRLLSADDLEDLFEDDSSESPFIDTPIDGDDSFLTAKSLETSPGFERGYRYIVQGSLQLVGDRDFFSIKTPESTDDVLSVHVRPNNGSNLVPRVQLYDRDQRPVAATILANGGGDLIVQATNVEPNKNYFIEVTSDASSEPFLTGNYELTAVVGSDITPLESVLSGQLQADAHRLQSNLFVGQDQFVHFLLENNGSSDGPMIIMRVFGSDEAPVFQVAAQPGKVRSGQTIRLGQGAYDIVVEGVYLSTDVAGQTEFTLRAAVVSDPLAVPLDDPANDPEYQCEGATGEFCFPGGIRTFDPFAFLPFNDSVTHTTASPAVVAQLYHNDWWTWRSTNTTPSTAVDERYDSYGGQRIQVPAGQGVLSNEEGESTLTALLIMPAGNGNVELHSDGSFIYEPAPGFFGTDTFAYLVTESINGLGMAKATVDVISPIVGDANLDRVVDAQDFAVWRAHIFEQSNLGFRAGDFNSDGYVDGSDFNAWLANRFRVAESTRRSTTATRKVPIAPLADVHAEPVAGMQRTLAKRETLMKRRQRIGPTQVELIDAVFAETASQWPASPG